MKIGVRSPDIAASLRARTTAKAKRALKRSVIPLYGRRGMGVVNNPRKAAYNYVYNRTTVPAFKSGTRKRRQRSDSRPSSDAKVSSNGIFSCFVMILIACILAAVLIYAIAESIRSKSVIPLVIFFASPFVILAVYSVADSIRDDMVHRRISDAEHQDVCIENDVCAAETHSGIHEFEKLPTIPIPGSVRISAEDRSIAFMRESGLSDDEISKRLEHLAAVSAAAKAKNESR